MGGRTRRGAGVDGLVVVDKPVGMTSHDVVARLRRVYGQQRVGHAGTLDPDATGVLLVGLGHVTRLLRWMSAADKEYRGTIVFGTATDTLDAAGRVVVEVDVAGLGAAQVESALVRFRGDVEQVPPMVSAVRVGGRRLHDLARAGVEVERAARPVTVSELVLEGFEPGPPPVATIRVRCSSGTYVRVLADDVGRALGGAAHLGSLRRLAAGGFRVAEAHPLEEIEANPGDVVLAPVAAARDLARVDVDAEVAAAVAHGAVLPPGRLSPGRPLPREPLAVVGPDGTLLAVYEVDDRRGEATARPAAVLVDAPART